MWLLTWSLSVFPGLNTCMNRAVFQAWCLCQVAGKSWIVVLHATTSVYNKVTACWSVKYGVQQVGAVISRFVTAVDLSTMSMSGITMMMESILGSFYFWGRGRH